MTIDTSSWGFLGMITGSTAKAYGKDASWWEDAQGRFALTPAQVQQFGLTERMRTALAEQGKPMPEPEPEVRPATGQTETADQWLDADDNEALEPVGAPQAPPPAQDAMIEMAISGGQMADGWRWWVIGDGDDDRAWIAYDNRPQVDAYWAGFSSTTKPPEFVQGRIPRVLFEFIHDGMRGILDTERGKDATFTGPTTTVTLD
jgi:hypothetical protein